MQIVHHRGKGEKKRKRTTLGGPDAFCIWESEQEKGGGNRKNKLYLLTFRVGNAIPALGSSALGSVNAVTAAPVPPSALPQRSEEKHSLNSSSFLLSLLQIHALQVHVATVKIAWDMANLNQRRPIVRLSSEEKH